MLHFHILCIRKCPHSITCVTLPQTPLTAIQKRTQHELYISFSVTTFVGKCSFSYVFIEFSEPWSAVGIATRLWNWQPRNSGSIPAWRKRFSLLQNIHTGSGAHSAVPGAQFPVVKQPKRKVNDVSPPSAVVRNAWSYTRTAMPSSVFMAWRGTNLTL